MKRVKKKLCVHARLSRISGATSFPSVCHVCAAMCGKVYISFVHTYQRVYIMCICIYYAYISSVLFYHHIYNITVQSNPMRIEIGYLNSFLSLRRFTVSVSVGQSAGTVKYLQNAITFAFRNPQQMSPRN